MAGYCKSSMKHSLVAIYVSRYLTASIVISQHYHVPNSDSSALSASGSPILNSCFQSHHSFRTRTYRSAFSERVVAFHLWLTTSRLRSWLATPKSLHVLRKRARHSLRVKLNETQIHFNLGPIAKSCSFLQIAASLLSFVAQHQASI